MQYCGIIYRANGSYGLKREKEEVSAGDESDLSLLFQFLLGGCSL